MIWLSSKTLTYLLANDYARLPRKTSLKLHKNFERSLWWTPNLYFFFALLLIWVSDDRSILSSIDILVVSTRLRRDRIVIFGHAQGPPETKKFKWSPFSRRTKSFDTSILIKSIKIKNCQYIYLFIWLFLINRVKRKKIHSF